MSTTYDDLSDKIIDELVKVVFDRFILKVSTNVEDLIKCVLQDFFKEAYNIVIESSSFYESVGKDESFLFPAGTRFLFNRNDFKVVVVEQPPQVRSVRKRT